MQLQKLKLITIVTEQLLREQIATKAMELGATGYTYQEVQGDGSRGAGRDSLQGPNVRIEIVCPQSVAEAILTHVSHNYFEHYACIAWLTDVEVMRGARYIRTPA